MLALTGTGIGFPKLSKPCRVAEIVPLAEVPKLSVKLMLLFPTKGSQLAFVVDREVYRGLTAGHRRSRATGPTKPKPRPPSGTTPEAGSPLARAKPGQVVTPGASLRKCKTAPRPLPTVNIESGTTQQPNPPDPTFVPPISIETIVPGIDVGGPAVPFALNVTMPAEAKVETMMPPAESCRKAEAFSCV